MVGHGFPKPRAAGSSPARCTSNPFARQDFETILLDSFFLSCPYMAKL